MCLHLHFVAESSVAKTVATFHNCLAEDTPMDLYYYHGREAVFEWGGNIFTLPYLSLLFSLFGNYGYSMLYR